MTATVEERTKTMTIGGSEYTFLVEDNDDYHARSKSGEVLSSHMFAKYRRCPVEFRDAINGKAKEFDSDAFKLGRATHALVLEGPDVYREQYAVGGPINPKTNKQYGADSKAFKVWAAEQDAEILTNHENHQAWCMREAFQANTAAVELVSKGEAELVIRTEFEGCLCQIRMDWLNPERGIVDLKTTRDIDKFESEIRKYGYIHQLAFYQTIFEAHTGLKPDIHIIALDKARPICGVWEISQSILDASRGIIVSGIADLKKSIETDTWLTGYEKVRKYRAM